MSRSHTLTLQMVKQRLIIDARQKMHIMIFSEFSSFQFPGPASQSQPSQNHGLGNQTPSATRQNKKKGFKQFYKAATKF